MTSSTLQNVLERARETRLTEQNAKSEFEPFGADCDGPELLEEFPEPETTKPLTAQDLSTLGLIELILKDRSQLDQAIRDPGFQRNLVPKFLTIALLSFLLFGVSLVIMLNAAGIRSELTAMKTVFDATDAGQKVSFLKFVPDTVGMGRWLDGSALQLIIAYSLG